MPARKEENMFSAKYTTHALEKLDASKLSKASRIPDTFQLADVPPQAAATDPHLLAAVSWQSSRISGQNSLCSSNMLRTPDWCFLQLSSQTSHWILHGYEWGGLKHPFGLRDQHTAQWQQCLSYCLFFFSSSKPHVHFIMFGSVTLFQWSTVPIVFKKFSLNSDNNFLLLPLIHITSLV